MSAVPWEQGLGLGRGRQPGQGAGLEHVHPLLQDPQDHAGAHLLRQQAKPGRIEEGVGVS